MTELVNTHHYYTVNAFATYKETFNKDHNLTVMGGYNYERYSLRKVKARAQPRQRQNRRLQHRC